MQSENTGWVAGWGTLALINAVLAQAHGRSGMRWFIVSLLIGPFATLLLALWYRGPRPADADPSRPAA
jgi:uncharacterized membrane protein